MTMDLKLKIKKHGYQRNGVGGEGFYYFLITFVDDSNKKREAIATLTVESDENSDLPQKFNGSCRVITPDNLDDHWRGDVFESEIRKLHEKWEDESC